MIMASLMLMVFALSACGKTENKNSDAENKDNETNIVENEQVTTTPETNEDVVVNTEQVNVYLENEDSVADYTEIKDVNGLTFYIPKSIVDTCTSPEDYNKALEAITNGEVTDEIKDMLAKPVITSDPIYYSVSDSTGSLMIGVYSHRYTDVFDINSDLSTFDTVYINSILDKMLNEQEVQAEDTAEATTDDAEATTDAAEQGTVKTSNIYAEEIVARDDTKVIAKVSGKVFGTEGSEDVNEYGYIAFVSNADGVNVMLAMSSDESSDWPILMAQSLKVAADVTNEVTDNGETDATGTDEATKEENVTTGTETNDKTEVKDETTSNEATNEETKTDDKAEAGKTETTDKTETTTGGKAETTDKAETSGTNKAETPEKAETSGTDKNENTNG